MNSRGMLGHRHKDDINADGYDGMPVCIKEMYGSGISRFQLSERLAFKRQTRFDTRIEFPPRQSCAETFLSKNGSIAASYDKCRTPGGDTITDTAERAAAAWLIFMGFL
jgi:hypothetical protein